MPEKAMLNLTLSSEKEAGNFNLQKIKEAFAEFKEINSIDIIKTDAERIEKILLAKGNNNFLAISNQLIQIREQIQNLETSVPTELLTYQIMSIIDSNIDKNANYSGSLSIRRGIAIDPTVCFDFFLNQKKIAGLDILEYGKLAFEVKGKTKRYLVFITRGDKEVFLNVSSEITVTFDAKTKISKGFPDIVKDIRKKSVLISKFIAKLK